MTPPMSPDLASLRALPHNQLADALLDRTPSELADIFRRIGDEALADLLAEIEPADAARLIGKLSHAQAAEVLEEMEPDDAADVAGELKADEAEAIFIQMDPADATEVRTLMGYPPESAGGIMTLKYVAIAPNLTTEEALLAVRAVAEEAETIYYLYVTDPATDVLLGVLSLRMLVLSHPDALLGDLMEREVIKVQVNADQEDAVRLLRQHHLLALPVVDAGNRLVGIITADDAIDVLVEEFNEDYFRLAGTDAAEMARRTPLQGARVRVPWLLGTMAIELGAGLVIARFDDVLQSVILLASFMPVISAVSGNVGLQSAAIVVRGLDTGHVSLNHWWRQVSRELATSFLMAIICSIVLGIIGAVWAQRFTFGIVIGGALLCSMLTAGFMGSIMPMVSKQLGFDPATTAGPFETAFQDVIGFAVFLWLASLLLHWLQ